MSTANPAPINNEFIGKAVANRVLLIGTYAGLSQPLEQGLIERNCLVEYAAGSADALRRLRRAAFEVIVTDPATSVEEDLALLSEIRAIRPGVRAIVLAPHTTPEEVISALRARVFLFKSAPFDAMEIAEYAARAAILRRLAAGDRDFVRAP